jgi:hypothetical protein
MNGREWVDECALAVDAAVQAVLDGLGDDEPDERCAASELGECEAACHLGDVAHLLVERFGDDALLTVAAAVVGGGCWSLEFWQLMDVFHEVAGDDDDKMNEAERVALFRVRVLDWQGAGLDEGSALVAAALGEVGE